MKIKRLTENFLSEFKKYDFSKSNACHIIEPSSKLLGIYI